MLFCGEGVSNVEGEVGEIEEEQMCEVEKNVGTYVDAPEFFHRIKGHDFFEQFIPVVALIRVSSVALVSDSKVRSSLYRWVAS